MVAFQADGSGLYTLQALWTQARESLDVTTIIRANRTYRILQIELMRAGVGEPSRAARGLTNLGEPALVAPTTKPPVSRFAPKWHAPSSTASRF